MKYILVELPNEVPDELMSGIGDAIRANIEKALDPNLVDVLDALGTPRHKCIVRYGSLYTSL